MAFVTISGFPSSGKSTFVAKLQADFERRIAASPSPCNLSVTVVGDELGLVGREVYSESKLEKPVRGSLLTTVNRNLSRKRMVICDGLNYIKGYRYQMNCSAKEAGVRHCTIHIVAPVDKCKEWNRARDPAEAYTEQTMEALLMRFEEPSSMARWDSPLFTVAWDDATLPFDEIWTTLTTGTKKKANTSTVPNGQTAPSTIETLHTTTSSSITYLLEHLSHPQRTITLSELQRLKRQFESIQMAGFSRGGAGVLRAGWGEREWAEAWVSFLQMQWETS